MASGELYGGKGTLFYRRFIDGEWVVAEGNVYDMLDLTPGGAHVVTELPQKFERVVVEWDYGTSNPTVFLAAGLKERTWTVFSEYRYDGREGRQRTDEEHSSRLLAGLRSLASRPRALKSTPRRPRSKRR